jgi:hypothetical protein
MSEFDFAVDRPLILADEGAAGPVPAPPPFN